MESTKTAKKILVLFDTRIDELMQIAHEVADSYWSLRMKGNDNTAFRHKSNLGCRVVAKGSQFTMTWFTNSYDRTGPEIKTYSTHLRKGRASFKYSEILLRKVSTKWEWEYVQEAEHCFAAVREELSALAKIRRALKTQIRMEKKIGEIVAAEDFDW